MQLEDFIKIVEAELADIPTGTIKPDTAFKQLDAWNSMQALIMIAMVDAECGVTLTAENLNDCITVSDLFSVVTAKRQQPSANS